jgi:multiple sugar transport system substrate-binding protein
MKMRRMTAALFAMALLATTAPADAKTVLSVLYPYPYMNKELHEEIARRFTAANPDIEIKFQAPAEEYEDAVQKTLRAAITKSLPDVAYQGLNRIRVFSERDLVVPLDPFIKAEAGWADMGYMPSMVSMGQIGDKTYGLPFSISTPILYVNMDLVRKAGGDPANFPKTWPEIAALGRRIQALGDNINGIYFEYTVTGNWMFQALVFSQGGRMMSADERQLAFGDAAGAHALDTLKQIGEAGMTDMPSAQAAQAFAAGKLGIYSTSTSRIVQMTKESAGRFEFRTLPFPVPASDGKLPAGGNVALMFTKDKAKQQAAWSYIKFATGPVGQTLMVNHTGYMPGNRIPVDDEAMLGKFYRDNPNHMTSIRQLPVITGWFAFPGEGALKITDVIKDHLQTVVTLKRPPADVLKAMTADVVALLPR